MNDAVNITIEDDVFLPCYHHLLESTADIDFLWGGRDSGKSTFIAQKLILDCLTLPYFRCIMIRKIGDTVKDSQWQTIMDVAEDWGIDHLFTFHSSPLQIKCANGNKFIARGCDNPAKLKSISNPSHVWFEEGNQLNRDDVLIIQTTLRSNAVKVKQYFSFNPEAEGDYRQHWLWTYFKDFVSRGEMTFSSSLSVKLNSGAEHVLRYTSTHTTYNDNPYCTADRQAMLENLITIDPFYYDVFVRGLWGNQQNDRPFVLAYKPEVHDGEPLLDANHPVILSFDFNKNPMCCSVIQHFDGLVRVLRTIKIANSDIYEMCEYVKALYPNCAFLVTGDATGRNKSAMARDSVHYYHVICQILHLNSMHIRVPKQNPPMHRNRMLVNAVLANYPCIIHKYDAAAMTFDFRNARCRSDGSLEKSDRDDPTQQLDALDTWRYFCNAMMQDYVKQPTLE